MNRLIRILHRQVLNQSFPIQFSTPTTFNVIAAQGLLGEWKKLNQLNKIEMDHNLSCTSVVLLRSYTSGCFMKSREKAHNVQSSGEILALSFPPAHLQLCLVRNIWLDVKFLDQFHLYAHLLLVVLILPQLQQRRNYEFGGF